MATARETGASVLSPDYRVVSDGGAAEMNAVIVGTAILVISTVGATLWARQSGAGKPRQAKILLFGLYFWILVFLQLILAAVGYSILTDR